MQIMSVLYQFKAEYDQVVKASQAVDSALGRIGSAQEDHISIQKRAAQGVSGFVSSLTSSIGKVSQWTYYVKAMGQTLMNTVSSFFAANASLEQTKIGFEQLLGSAEKAQAFINQLWDFAKKTPFEFNQLTNASYMLIGVGIAAKDVIPWLRGIGDAVSGVGGGAENIQRVTQAITQMAARGKITGEEMMQLTTNRIPAWNLLAQAMHKSVAEVTDMSQKGKLMSATVLPLLIAQMEKAYGGQMAAQAGTFNGVLSNLKDTWGDMVQVLKAPVFVIAKKWLVELADAVARPEFRAFAVTMGVKAAEGLTIFIGWIQSGISWIGKLWTTLGENGTLQSFGVICAQLRDIGKNLIDTFLLIFVRHISDINTKAPTAGESVQKVADAVQRMADSIMNTLAFLRDMTGLFADTGVKGELARGALIGIAAAIAAIKIINFVGGIATAVTNLGNLALGADGATASLGLLNVVKNWQSLTNLISLIPTLVGLFGLWAAGAWTAATGMIAATWPILLIVAGIALLAAGIYLLIRNWGAVSAFIVGVWGAVTTFIGDTLGKIGRWFGDRWADVQNITMGVFNNVWTFIQQIWNNVTGFLFGVLSNIGSFFTEKLTALGTFVGGIFQWIFDQTIGPFMPMLAWFGSVFQALWQIFLKAMEFIIGLLAIGWGVIIGGIVTAWNFITHWISVAWNFISNLIGNAIANIAGFMSYWWNRISQGVTVIWAAIWASISHVWDLVMAGIGVVLKWLDDHIFSGFRYLWSIISGKMEEIRANIEHVWNLITATIGGAIDLAKKIIGGWIDGAKKAISDGFNAAKDAVANIWKGLVNGIITALNWGLGALRGFLNGIADAINNVEATLGVDVKYKVKHVDSWLKDIPKLAGGSGRFVGGLAVVGEEGPELVSLPRGASVATANQTRSMMGGFPGFAGGIGDVLGDIWNNITNIGSSIVNTFTGGFKLPGVLQGIAESIPSNMGKWITSFISGIMPKLNLPTASYGEFQLPGGLASWTSYGQQLWYGVHQGMDFPFPQGSALHEAIGGRVSRTGFYDWGGEVDVALTNGLTERYEHLSAIYARVGDIVKRGALLGLTGGGTAASGLGYWSRGAHLHVQYDHGSYGSSVNPLSVWKSYGIFKPFAHGGVINEEIFGVGRSGRGYRFGESGPETITPGTGGQHTTIINIDGREFARAIGPALVGEIVLQIGGAHV